MKKLFTLKRILMLMSASFLLAPVYVQAQTSPANTRQAHPRKCLIDDQPQSALQSNVARRISERNRILEREKYYLFDRVKTMCREWPKCKEWAMTRRKENPSFTIIDAEVEYYVEQNSGWPFWQHNFYVKVLENLQEQFYVFRTEINHKSENPYSFPDTPQKIAKFPGHPFTDMPSNHARYELEERYGAPYHSKKMRQRWPEISDEHWWQMGRGVEQQRVIWDKNGNPCWERRFDYIISSGIYPVEDMKRYAVIARQNKLGEPFKYIDAKKANSILIRAHYIPHFCITVVYRPKEVSNK